MLANATKLVDKNFAIGFLIPTIAATAAATVLYRDVGFVTDWYDELKSQDSFGSYTFLALGVWLAATLLLILNEGIYRMLEGYVGPLAWGRLASRQRRRIKAEKGAIEAAAVDPSTTAQAYYKRLWQYLQRSPIDETLVLPTRFGNAIRAFEVYSYDVYGADAIPIWLRLQYVMPKEAQAAVNDARAHVDFFVNTCVLALIVALLAAARLLFVTDECALRQGAFCLSARVEHYAFVAVAAAAAATSYAVAVNRAIAWGEFVKACFDVYLPVLAKQLGYRLPTGMAGRKEFWNALSRMLVYREAIDPAAWASTATPADDASRPAASKASADEDEDEDADEKG